MGTQRETERRNDLFPGLWGALWLVLASLILEVLVYALLADLLSGQDVIERAALARLLANAVLFTGLLTFKRLSYRALFHDGEVSVRATLAATLIPVVALVPGLFVLNAFGAYLLNGLFELSRWEERAFSDMLAPTAASVFFVCLLAPALEEMLFRGVILRSFLHRYAPGVAIVHSAAVFGLAHMNVYQFVVAMLMGLVLGWIYERTRSLWPCIALHAAYNTSVLLLAQSSDGIVDAPAAIVAALVLSSVSAAWLRRRLGWPGGPR